GVERNRTCEHGVASRNSLVRGRLDRLTPPGTNILVRSRATPSRSRPSALAVFRLTTSSYLVGRLHRQISRLRSGPYQRNHGPRRSGPTSASSSSKARTKLPGGPRRGLGLSQIGRQNARAA